MVFLLVASRVPSLPSLEAQRRVRCVPKLTIPLTCAIYEIHTKYVVVHSQFELDKCIAVDPATGQSAPVAVWHSCNAGCSEMFEELDSECYGCQDSDFHSFLVDAGSKLVRCEMESGNTCASLGPTLDTACCAGRDQKVGTTDDTCSIQNGTMPGDCEANAICAAAVQASGAFCPLNFTSDPALLGMYQDCGGDLAQILAARPVRTVRPNYCDGRDGNRRLASAEEVERKASSSTSSRTIIRMLQVDPGGSDQQDPACSTAYHAAYSATMSGDCDITHSTCSACCPLVFLWHNSHGADLLQRKGVNSWLQPCFMHAETVRSRN